MFSIFSTFSVPSSGEDFLKFLQTAMTIFIKQPSKAIQPYIRNVKEPPYFPYIIPPTKLPNDVPTPSNTAPTNP